jgi:hypothetical protein
MCAKRASVHVVPNKNMQYRHSKNGPVKWSFSRRLVGNVSHTRLRGCANGANAARANTPAPHAGKTSAGNRAVSRKEFPTFFSHDAARCFNCERALDQTTRRYSGFHDGEFRAQCPHCRMWTFYNVGNDQ